MLCNTPLKPCSQCKYLGVIIVKLKMEPPHGREYHQSQPDEEMCMLPQKLPEN